MEEDLKPGLRGASERVDFDSSFELLWCKKVWLSCTEAAAEAVAGGGGGVKFVFFFKDGRHSLWVH